MPLDEIRATGEIAARRREPAAHVLDQRAGDDVRTGFERLALFHQLAVAVVDEHDRLGRSAADRLGDRRDRVDRERGAHGISARALDEHHGRPLRAHRLAQRREIGVAVRHARHLGIAHAARDERVRRRRDRMPQRVVRRAVGCQQQRTGRHERVETRDDRVRAADDRQPREHALRAEDARQQRLVALARRVVVAVPRRPGEIALGDPFVHERAQHARAHRGRARVAALQPRRCALRARAHAGVDVETAEQRGGHAAAARIARADSVLSYTRTNGSQIAPATIRFTATSTHARQSSVATNTLANAGTMAGV